MFTNLRNEVKRSRELCYDILGRELQDKNERYQKLEMLLNEPLTTQADLENITNEVRRLQRECQALDEKLSASNPNDDKLAIYKTQASNVSKKKNDKLE